jgi:large subunit ribosomal protein L25
MATMKLKADTRQPHKKGGARRLRREGRVPGILYGQGEESLPVSFDGGEFDALLRAREGTVIIEVGMEDRAPQQTIIREIQRDPVTGAVVHVDLQHISLTEKVQVEVPVNVVGTPFGVKTEGGILEHHLRTVLIKCLPTEIPPRIDVDVTELHIGKSIHAGELAFDRDKVEVMTEEKATIVSVIPPRIIKEPVAAEAEAEAEAAEGAEGEAEEGADADKDKDKESS